MKQGKLYKISIRKLFFRDYGPLHATDPDLLGQNYTGTIIMYLRSYGQTGIWFNFSFLFPDGVTRFARCSGRMCEDLFKEVT